MTQRRYEWSSKGMDRDRKNDSGLLDMDDEMTKNVVYGAAGLAVGAIAMHYAMKHNILGLGRPAAAPPAPPVLPAQAGATNTSSAPPVLPAQAGATNTSSSPPAASPPPAASSGVRLGVFT